MLAHLKGPASFHCKTVQIVKPDAGIKLGEAKFLIQVIRPAFPG
jgi:hypothetical protein